MQFFTLTNGRVRALILRPVLQKKYCTSISHNTDDIYREKKTNIHIYVTLQHPSMRLLTSLETIL